ncbi:MAG: VOC family protein [Dermatophilaceae bacterium]
MATITPFLWFDDQLEQALDFYTRVFPNSRVAETARYPEGSPGKAGTLMTAAFELDGQRFIGLNGGPHDAFNDAVSFVVACADQAEADRYWAALTDGGTPVQCGWLKDRFGVSWQVVPHGLTELLADPDPQRARRATEAMLAMVKLDIAAIRAAADGVGSAPA